MDPAPADGVYEPEYSYPGVPGGRYAPGRQGSGLDW